MGILSFLRNPMRWQNVTSYSLYGNLTYKKVKMFGCDLPESVKPFVGLAVFEENRFGKRRYKILDLHGITLQDLTTLTPVIMWSKRWVRTGDLEQLRASFDEVN